jgi:hypothetical protein
MEIGNWEMGIGATSVDAPRQWQIAKISEIEWVRLVRNRGCLLGIGFHRDQLVQFLGTDEADGLVRHVSVIESALLLWHLAGQELRHQPDVESQSAAWRRWLGTFAK